MANIDVRDAAQAHILAMESLEAAGERFIVADTFLWFHEVSDILRKAFLQFEKQIPHRDMPSFLLRILAWFNPVMKQVVPELNRQRSVSSEKAHHMLGWSPRSSREAIIAAANSVVEQQVV